MTHLFRTLAAVLVAFRFHAFRTELDHPHLWRQADTAFYSLGFYRFGMNIFTPSVAWMGSYRHVILEFPLTEWIAACVYMATGPTILVDRLVNVGFFLGSAFYLFRIVRLVSDDTLARIATVVYMAAPLGIYYSRAAHIDFTAVCFSHALLYYTMRVVISGRRRDLALAIGAGTLAFVIKSPYAFYLIVPALTFCYLRRAVGQRWLETLAAFAIPALAFCGWFAYVQSVNRRAPDLSFIPSYFPHVDRFTWYLGTMADRWTLEPWLNVTGRVFREIAVTVWWVLLPFGLLIRHRVAAYYAFALAWTAGTLVYLALFLTLNNTHNYYQIPFIAPFSLLLAVPIYACWTVTGERARAGRAVAAALLVCYVGSSMFVATRRFYGTNPVPEAAGRFIASVTSDTDLVVMSCNRASYTDPSFLFYARRYGWSVSYDDLSPRIIQRLLTHGATIVVTSTEYPPDQGTRAYLEQWPILATTRVPGNDIIVRRLAPDPKSW